jgi:CubicO group peptidase (beta-lactamase class C family)
MIEVDSATVDATNQTAQFFQSEDHTMLKKLRALSLLVLVSMMCALPASAFFFQSDLAARLEAMEKTIEEKRKAAGVPGISIVVVKDDRVIYIKGLGLRDVERNLPATADTLFAIGSCSKAFTAMIAEMSVDDGKLSLDDAPKKYLPYFKLQDPDADARITVRDLLHHSSGLSGTDIAWYTGVLSREEVIRVAGAAKPTAKFREKFQYQNVMYSAAGEVVARAQKSSWERLIADRVFKPLGMKASDTSVRVMQKAADFATGYDIADKTPRKLALRDLTNIAPAGAINSNARDMAQWLRLMLGQGVFEGRRLVSERGFNEMTSKHIDAGGGAGYGLGWGVLNYRGHKILAHSGGIDGFNSLVVLVPDQKLGFCLLTNVSSSTLPLAVREAVFANLIDKPEQPLLAAPRDATVDARLEAGKYRLAEAGFDVEVIFKDGKLTMRVPGQPDYPLINAGGRRYKLDAPAPDGFYITFRPVKGRESDTEAYLEQPHGNYTLPKVKAEAATADGQMKELIGSYDLMGQTIEIAARDGKVSLIAPGQPPYPLVEKEKDTFALSSLPDTYRLMVKRDASGKVSAILIKQPEGEFEGKRKASADAAKVSITTEELMAKVILASGGEANLRKRQSVVTTGTVELENQGLTGEWINYAKAPNRFSSVTKLMALGKKIGVMREYFDGETGGTETDFSPASPYKGKLLDDARIAAVFHQELEWKTLFKSVVVKEVSKVGDEEVYVVVKTPEKGNPVTDYISTKTFLPVKRDRMVSSPAGDGAVVVSETFSDYRPVDGVMVPFHVVAQNPGLGSVITRIKEIKFNVAVPDSEFKSQKQK